MICQRYLFKMYIQFFTPILPRLPPAASFLRMFLFTAIKIHFRQHTSISTQSRTHPRIALPYITLSSHNDNSTQSKRISFLLSHNSAFPYPVSRILLASCWRIGRQIASRLLDLPKAPEKPPVSCVTSSQSTRVSSVRKKYIALKEAQ